jgi:hypothetical protein
LLCTSLAIWPHFNNTHAPSLTVLLSGRLFVNISLAVRVLTWSVVKMGGLVLRGAFYDVRCELLLLLLVLLLLLP